jgi:hypothetical protein
MGLLSFEQFVYGGTIDEKSVASLRMFCRLDIGLTWNTEEQKYMYVVTGVHEGLCSLSMLTNSAVQRAFISAYQRGALDDITPPNPHHM